MTPDEQAFRSRVGDVLDAGGAAVPPDQVIRALGAAGLLQERWSRPDALFALALIDELGGRGQFDASVAVGLHVEACTGILRRHAPEALRPLVAAVQDGTAVACIGTTEEHAGSDLSAVRTEVTPTDDGWRVVGEKKYVTLSTTADVMLVLGRTGPPDAPRPALVVVPRAGFEVVEVHRMEGVPDLDTARVTVDAHVPRSHLLGRPGMGVALLTGGLVRERFAITAQILATCRLALSLAVTRAHRRHQHGSTLWEHQALRLRLAELHAERTTLSAHLRVLALAPEPPAREIAGLKLLSARFGERCLSECMHVFGAEGYTQGATPLGRLWRSIRLGRVGGGTDEMMAEVVAHALRPDDELYDRHVPGGGRPVP